MVMLLPGVTVVPVEGLVIDTRVVEACAVLKEKAASIVKITKRNFGEINLDPGFGVFCSTVFKA